MIHLQLSNEKQFNSNVQIVKKCLIGELYERYDRKRAFVKFQSRSEVIKVMHGWLEPSLTENNCSKILKLVFKSTYHRIFKKGNFSEFR